MTTVQICFPVFFGLAHCQSSFVNHDDNHYFFKADDLVAFVNAEAGTLELGLKQNEENCYSVQGGEVLRTTETIINSGDYPFLYQCARFGNSSYTFKNLSPGDYIVDLHFAEIIHTRGPKGMRVFDVYIQNEKACTLNHFFFSTIHHTFQL